MNLKFLLSVCCAACTAIVCAQAPADLYVDTASKGHDIPKSMYGIFFEEINHSGDGGLYAELIQNRAFEEHVIPSGTTYSNGRVYAPAGKTSWSDGKAHNFWFDWDMEAKKYLGWTVESSRCSVSRLVETPTTPLHANTPNAMRLTITGSAVNALASLVNSGYWGIAVNEGQLYDLRFYLLTSDYSGKVTANIRNSSKTSVATRSFDVIADGKWHEYTAILTSEGTFGDGSFSLDFSGNGTILIDYVSLFPQDTYKGRKNGLRRDLAEAIVGLNPNFMRWPGGCIVEGLTLENRVKWKETLGDPMTRRGEYDLWGYRSTWGLGYHECLLFCEDAGMDAMFVGNLGMSCGGRNGDYVTTKAELQPYIDDIRDAIEYAIGDPASNPWAKKRAKAGHPQKFPLKYVELGNENWGADYAKLFNWAYEELKAAYPEIIFINTMAHFDGSLAKVTRTDMVDPHWYQTPDWFYNSTYEFDNIDRSKSDWKIYVGEYACNEQVGTGNLDAALSESVFMINMERNSDIVTMTSYAPLVSNQNAPNWTCNLIWINNRQVVGRASYYAQKLFSENRPDYNVRSRLTTGSATPPYAGRIALGTFATTAEFRNVKVSSPVDGRVLYQNSLAAESPEWSDGGCPRGTWVWEDGVLKQTSLDQSTYFTLDNISFNEIVFEVEAKKTGGDEGFLINIGTNENDINHSYRFNIGGWGNTSSTLEDATGYWGSIIAPHHPHTIDNGRWYKIKMVGHNGTIRCYIDGTEYAAYTAIRTDTDNFPGRLNAGAGYDSRSGEVVVKVVNANSQPLRTTVHLNATDISPEGTAIVLQGDEPFLENSFSRPDLIVPRQESFGKFAGEFEYTFPPYSLTILRTKAAPASSQSVIPSVSFTDRPKELTVNRSTPLSRAYDRLQRLIDRCEASVIEGAVGIDKLRSAVNAAINARESVGATELSLNRAFDSLAASYQTFCQAQMITANELTHLIGDSDFSEKTADAWIGSVPVFGSGVAEFFNCNFSMSQTVSNLENGYYLLTLQGFYRPGLNGADAHSDRSEQLNALICANGYEVPVRSMYSTDISQETMTGAANLFRAGDTSSCNYLFAKVTDGSLKISLVKRNLIDRDWTCFNRFRLFRVGTSSGIGNIVPDSDDSVSADDSVYDMHGRRVGCRSDIPHLTPGIYVVGNEKFSVK